MKLATLDNSIQDALATRDHVAQQINQLLRDNRSEQAVAENAKQQDSMRLAKHYVAQAEKALALQRTRIQELQASNAARRAAIEAGRVQQEKVAADVTNAADKLSHSRELVVTDRNRYPRPAASHLRESVSRVRYLRLVPLGPPLSFQICGLALPNTTYDSGITSNSTTSEEGDLCRARPCRAHHAQSAVLSRHPASLCHQPYGSRSSIRDDISKLLDNQREFPLYLTRRRSTAQFRFDYGWFLMNKNIEVLCISQGLKVVDIRHTLPNLKYLLYVCSAGNDEDPGEEAGEGSEACRPAG